MFQSEFLECLFNCVSWQRTGLVADNVIRSYYPKLAAVDQVHAAELIEMLKKCKYMNIFKAAMNSLNHDIMNKSSVHGREHAERVALFSFVLALKEENMSENDFKICLEAAKYHDIGREHDNHDPSHGILGAKKYIQFFSNSSQFTAEEINCIAIAISAHSVSDSNFVDICSQLPIQPQYLQTKFKKLVQILKDADALDRFRLGNQSLELSYLHLKRSIHLVYAACEIANIKPIDRIS